MGFSVGLAFLAVVLFGAGVAGEVRVLGWVSVVLRASGGLGSGFLCQFSTVFLGVVRRCVVCVGFGAPSAPEVGGMSRRL